MEFTSFNDLKNLLGTESDSSMRTTTLKQTNLMGGPLKMRHSQYRRGKDPRGKRTLVINKDTEMLHYQYRRKAEMVQHMHQPTNTL